MCSWCETRGVPVWTRPREDSLAASAQLPPLEGQGVRCVRWSEWRPAPRPAMWAGLRGSPGSSRVRTRLSRDPRGLPHSLDCELKPMRLVRSQGGNTEPQPEMGLEASRPHSLE